MEFEKIKVSNPIVEMDGPSLLDISIHCKLYYFLEMELIDSCLYAGDEMTRVIWKSIKNKVCFQF